MTILKGITWDHPRGYAPLEAASRAYEERFSVRVAWERRSLTAFGDQGLEELANAYDLLIIDHPHVGTAMEAGCLAAAETWLDPQALGILETESAGPSFSSYRYGGSQWALPVDAAVQCAAWRPDLLGELPVPGSWEEVFSLAARLRSGGLWIGMALCPTDAVCTFLTLTAQMGSPVREGAGVLVGRRVGMEALSRMQRMRDAFHPDALAWNPIGLFDHMAEQDDIAYAPLAFGYTNYAREGFRRRRLRFTGAPGGAGALLGGAGIAVSARRPFCAEAARYAAWVAGAPVQASLYVAAEGQPANVRAWQNESANGLTGHFFRDTLPALKTAFLRPRYSGWPALQQQIGERLHRWLSADTNAGEVLDELEDLYRQSDLPLKRLS